MERLSCGLELKFADGLPGEFDGYGSVFGVIDSHGDVVAPGAFTSSLARLKAENRGLPMYMQHGMMLGADPRPVGVWTALEEDGKGLRVKGKLVGLDTETGKFNYALVKEGAMRGLSIGYRTIKADYAKQPTDPRRTLKEVKLFEVSIVDDPSNAQARIDGIKAGATATTIREFEDFLRDVGGFSHAAAKAIAAGGFKARTDPRDEDGGQYADALRRLTTTLKP